MAEISTALGLGFGRFFRRVLQPLLGQQHKETNEHIDALQKDVVALRGDVTKIVTIIKETDPFDPALFDKGLEEGLKETPSA